MGFNCQTALVKWMPSSDSQNSIFSAYRSENTIEIHAGCEERKNARLICTQTSYDDICEFCELLAEQTGLPVQDYTQDTSK